jgi:hypothetical protein
MSSDYNNVSDISVADTLVEGWHLFSVKWSLTEFSLFIDGVKVVTDTTPSLMSSVSADLSIGSGPRLNLVRNGYVTAGNNTNFPGFKYTTNDYVSSVASLSATNNMTFTLSDYISIDPNKSYIQSGNFKSIGTGGNSKAYYGFITYDKEKLFIDPVMTNHYINTETKLAQDLKPNDTVVYLESSVNWKKSTDNILNRYIGIYPYKDYPVYTYTRKFYNYTDNNTTTNTITLSSAYTGVTIPAGTKVANNYNAYGTYTYSTLCYTSLSTAWEKYSSIIAGNVVNITNWKQFRYGTRYIQIVFLVNYGQSSLYTMLVDDIEFIDTTNTIYNSKIQEMCISNIARSDSDILNRYKTGILASDNNVTYMLTEQ